MPIFDKKSSKIKLWVGKGGEKGQVFYSVISQNGKPEEFIIEKMTKRILHKKFKGLFTLAIFYNNETREKIKSVKGNFYKNKEVRNSINKRTANIKLWIGLPSYTNNDTWYNIEAINDFDNDKIIELMTNYILRDKYKYEFTKAMFFNNQSGMFLKEIEGDMKSE